MTRKYTKTKSRSNERHRMERAHMIRQLMEKGMKQAQIAHMMGISRQAVNQILYRYKDNARHEVYLAVKNGLMIKPEQCEQCKEVKILQAHHNDYGVPLDVNWLCSDCHIRPKPVGNVKNW